MPAMRIVSAREKHLHERGEDIAIRPAPIQSAETPPRAWRRRPEETPHSGNQRNTSTSVEKTESTTRRTGFQQKHLHVRGEDFPF